MGKGADISWLHPPGFMPGATWSPWSGCTKVNRRFRGGNWGKGAPRRVTAKSGWKHPLAWATAAAKAGKRMLVAPLDCDPLDSEVLERDATDDPSLASSTTAGWFMHLILGTGNICGFCGRSTRQNHDGCTSDGGLIWLLLTKRPENWRWIPEDVRRFCWLIYSASDQATLDAGMPHLLEAEGFAGLGLSLEPLVGPIDFRRQCHATNCEGECGHASPFALLGGRNALIDWVIIGGESGQKARNCNVTWIRDIVRQCRSAGAVPFVKQAGSRAVFNSEDDLSEELWRELDAREEGMPRFPATVSLAHGGANLADMSEDLRIQEWPEGLR